MKNFTIVRDGRGKNAAEIGEVYETDFDGWAYVDYETSASEDGFATREQAVKALHAVGSEKEEAIEA